VITASIQWVSVDEGLPPMNTFVLIYRVGGKNDHHDVGIGYRSHKWGTMDEWDWHTTGYGQAYWGISVDGSRVAYWAEKPVPPVPKIMKQSGPERSEG
jgi:hypothetical protein